MVKALFDTNILIDYLNGEEKAKNEINQYEDKYISIVTYIEVLVRIPESSLHEKIKNYLLSFHIIDIKKEIVDRCVILRTKYNLKIPDALILASSYENDALLITRNTKGFNSNMPFVRIPYTL